MRCLALLAVVLCSPTLLAQVPAFPAASHGKGDLVHIHGVPVLTLVGTHAEMGEQFGILAIRNAPRLPRLVDQFLTDLKLKDGFEGLKTLAASMRKRFPPSHLIEMDAAAKASGFDRGVIDFANTVYDLSSGMGCSTIVVEKNRSVTGAPIFGRNFDWVPSDGISEHTLVVVYRPTGKRAFATVTITPIFGCISGMNDAGLAVTINEIFLRRSKDKAAFNWGGTPMLALYRQVLEECSTVAEAEAFLRKSHRTTSACMTVCDKNGGAVFEFTPKTVEVRAPNNGVTCCTNHFRSETLGVGEQCWRMKKLLTLHDVETKFGVADVFVKLHEVNAGKPTLQSMVFEPTNRKLHLKYGHGPATTKHAVELDLFR
jgi:isopenicillin-N N-acyltransferase like protein